MNARCIFITIIAVCTFQVSFSDTIQKVQSEQEKRQEFLRAQMILALEQLEKENKENSAETETLRRMLEAQKRQESEQFEKEQGCLKKEKVEHIIKNAPQEIKKILQSFSNAKKVNDEFTRNKIIPSCIMLEGPAGTGKTSIAMAMAQRIGRPIYVIEASMLATKYKDSGSENLKEAIEQAVKKHGEVTLILEELPSLVDTKKDEHRSDTDPGTTLWRLMDRYKEDKKVIFIATANNIERLPEPLKTRFDKATVHIDYPNDKSKIDALRYQLGKYSDESLIKEIVKNTSKFSYRNIEDLSERMIAYLVEHNKQKITFEECKPLIQETKLLSTQNEGWYQRFTREYFRGCHLPFNKSTKTENVLCGAKNCLSYLFPFFLYYYFGNDSKGQGGGEDSNRSSSQVG